MGASAWGYFVPYQDDVKDALDRLHQQVFENGEFWLRPPMEAADYDLESLPGEVREEVELLLEQDRQYTKPTTINELRNWNREEGTHSILDISDIGLTPDLGIAAPLPSEQLMDLFGTQMPERRIVEEKADQIQSLRSSWQATYIIVFKDGLPDEIFFTGYSGD